MAGTLVHVTAPDYGGGGDGGGDSGRDGMHRSGRVAMSIMRGFIVAVLIASAAVVAYTQWERAEQAEQQVEQVKDRLQDRSLELLLTQGRLTSSESEASLAKGWLDDVQGRLTAMTSSRDEVSQQRQELSQRLRPCVYAGRVSEHLSTALRREANADTHLSRGRYRLAARAEDRADIWARRADRVLARSGYRSAAALSRACAPQ